MSKRRKRRQIAPQSIGLLMAALLVFVAASQSTDQYIFASWFVPPLIAHLLSFGMTGLLVVLLVAEQFHLTGFARGSSIFAIVLLLLNQALVNVTVNLTIAQVDARTLDLLTSTGLSNHQALLFLSFLQGAFRPLLEMLLWPVVAFVLTNGERASFAFWRSGEQGEAGDKQVVSKVEQREIAQKQATVAHDQTVVGQKQDASNPEQIVVACEHPGCAYEAIEAVVNGDIEQARAGARRRLIGHQNRVHGSSNGRVAREANKAKEKAK